MLFECEGFPTLKSLFILRYSISGKFGIGTFPNTPEVESTRRNQHCSIENIEAMRYAKPDLKLIGWIDGYGFLYKCHEIDLHVHDSYVLNWPTSAQSWICSVSLISLVLI